MRGFKAVDGGWESPLEDWELEFLADLLAQVLVILDSAAPPGPRPGRPAGAAPPGPGGPRAAESARDAEILAALDFDIEEPGDAGESDPNGGPGGPGTGTGPDVGRRDWTGSADWAGSAAPPAASAALAPLIEALLPDASEDPDVAVEVAAMTRGRLRALKSERARRVMAELIEPTGARGAVRVSAGTEQDWLGALNDLRLVLAQRLGIDSAEAAEDVHAIAREEPPPHESDEFRWRRGVALSYDMLTWWQESLLRVLLRGQGPA